MNRFRTPSCKFIWKSWYFLKRPNIHGIDGIDGIDCDSSMGTFFWKTRREDGINGTKSRILMVYLYSAHISHRLLAEKLELLSILPRWGIMKNSNAWFLFLILIKKANNHGKIRAPLFRAPRLAIIWIRKVLSILSIWGYFRVYLTTESYLDHGPSIMIKLFRPTLIMHPLVDFKWVLFQTRCRWKRKIFQQRNLGADQEVVSEVFDSKKK